MNPIISSPVNPSEVLKALIMGISEFIKKGLTGRLNFFSVIVLLGFLVALFPLMATTQIAKNGKVSEYLIQELGPNETVTFNLTYKTKGVYKYEFINETNTSWSDLVIINTSSELVYKDVRVKVSIPENLNNITVQPAMNYSQNNNSLIFTLPELDKEFSMLIEGFFPHFENIPKNLTIENITQTITQNESEKNLPENMTKYVSIKNLTENVTQNLVENTTSVIIEFSKPIQQNMILGQPGEWEQNLKVQNKVGVTQNVSLDLKGAYENSVPQEAFEISVYEIENASMVNKPFSNLSSNLELVLGPNEVKTFRINYKTAPLNLYETLEFENGRWTKLIFLNTTSNLVYSNVSFSTEIPSQEFTINKNLSYSQKGNVLFFRVLKLKGKFSLEISGHSFLINYGKLEQGQIIINEPVNWTQNIEIENILNESLEQNLTLAVPEDAFNIKISFDNDTSLAFKEPPVILPLFLNPRQILMLKVEFQTSPVRIAVINKSLELLDLIPRDALNIEVYENGELKYAFPSAKSLQKFKIAIPSLEKRIQVYHNSSLHYKNVVVQVPIDFENPSFYKEENGSFIESSEASLVKVAGTNRLKWVIPELSGANLTVKQGIEKIQGKAEINKNVLWTLKAGNHTITYETLAPYLIEENIRSGKKITVKSDSSVHYKNVKSYISIPEISEELNFYHISTDTNGSTKKELINSNPLYDVSFIDTNGNGLYDRVEWNVPQLSEDVYELKLIILNVQSYPQVGGNWTVAFNTTGSENLTIIPIDSTTFSEKEVDNSSTKDDLNFLEIKKGHEKILNYYYLVKPEDLNKLGG